MTKTHVPEVDPNTDTVLQTAEREGLPFRRLSLLDRPFAVALALGIVTFATFFSILGFSFVNYDDGTNIFANPHLTPTVTGRGIGYLWTHGYYELYMPVTYTLWGLIAYFAPVTQPIYVPGGGNAFVSPAAFHTVSLLLHIANVLLVFALLRRVAGGRPWVAGAGALLFALHPVQVESVAWATGMNNLTSGFFGLLALCFYVAAADSSARTVRAARLRYAAATLCFVLALLSKPTAAALPLVAAVLDWGALRRPPRRWFFLLAPWVALSLALIVVTRLISETSRNVDLALWVRPFIAGDALAYYLAKLVLPLRTSINVGRTPGIVLGHWWGYITWLFPAVLLAALWAARGRLAHPYVTAFLLFIAAVLPTLGLIPFYGMALTTVADRYLYVAMLGPALALSWFLAPGKSAATRNAMVRQVVALGVLAFCGVRTLAQIPTWKDTQTLSASMVRVNPDDAPSRTNFAITLAERGRSAEALPHFRAAVRLKPGDAVYRYHLGAALEDTGNPQEAVVFLREAVRLDPRFVVAQIRLGGALLKLRQNRDALGPLKAAVLLAPNDSAARYLLGVALSNQQRFVEAEAEFRRVLSLPAAMPRARVALGTMLAKQGRRQEAEQVYEEALRLAPDDAAAKQALKRLRTAPRK
ncbi:MAG: tetratricopeptide repeat protein [Cytophagales bacterium]|nr:tetratricopeptide repeat protein [Armatimonadota bacterium]